MGITCIFKNEELNSLAQAYQQQIGETVQFDYTNQAWVINGRYVRCGHQHCHPHPSTETQQFTTTCYGTIHEGERPHPNAELH